MKGTGEGTLPTFWHEHLGDAIYLVSVSESQEGIRKEESLNSSVDSAQVSGWSLKHECMNCSAEESKKKKKRERIELRSELPSTSCERGCSLGPTNLIAC